jgi:hypothetical protein
MDYKIKSEAANIAAKIEAVAGSATILKTALLAVAGQADVDGCPAYVGYISEDRLIEILRSAIPEESTSEQWREYRLDADAYRRKVVFNNLFCGCEIFIEYSVVNTQYIVSAGFVTMFGGGREYRCTGSEVETYRLRHTAEKI